jgi:hypothetical protein
MRSSGASLLEDGIYDHATSEKLFCLGSCAAGYTTGHISNGASSWKPYLGSEVHFEAIQTAATIAVPKRSLHPLGAAADVSYYAACMYILLELCRTRDRLESTSFL